MIKIGITGTIAAGKSEVSRLLREWGYPVFDADAAAHDALETTSSCYPAIVSAFGKEILDQEGCIVRSALARIIFRNSEERTALNEIIHPYVYDEMGIFFDLHREEDLVFAEIPLLFEVGWQNAFDRTLVITCRQETAVERMIRMRGYTEEEALARINAQMSAEEKCEKADDVIYNDGTKEELAEQLQRYILERKEE